MPTKYEVLRGLTAASRVADEYLKQEQIKEDEMGINDLSETGHLARVILDIFPKRGGENAIRLARAIRTMIITTISEAEEKPAALEIPEGWTAAGEPPDSVDGVFPNVEVMFKDKTRFFGWSNLVAWYKAGDELIVKMRSPAYRGEALRIPADQVLCWRELPPPAPKLLAVGDVVMVRGTITEMDESDSELPYHVTVGGRNTVWTGPSEIEEISK